jgi:hypothetical protein
VGGNDPQLARKSHMARLFAGDEMQRVKPRDLYDLWMLRRQGVQHDMGLIERKLALYELRWRPEALEEVLERVRADWAVAAVCVVRTGAGGG